MDEELLPFFLSSLSLRQGRSNSHQLIWFFSETVGQVVAAFILISETNGRCVQDILGQYCCSYLEWRVKAGWQKKEGEDAMKALHRTWHVFHITHIVWLACAHNQEEKNLPRERHTGNVCIDLKKGALESARWCEWKGREIIQEWEMCNLLLSQPQQHNKVIKSDRFARYFEDDICPSLCVHPHSLSMCQSLYLSASQC